MDGTNPITNSEDVIDSRDVIARIEYLRETCVDESGRWIGSDEEESEFVALEALAAEAEGTPDWTYGETLIRDSYFEDYARELAEDIGAVNPDANWPLYCIDWERAARDLQVDYFSVDFDGIDYWVRS